MARNSASSSIHIPAELQNASTRNNAAFTGLREVITPIAANTVMAANT
jgi:hypothetical protein